MSLPAGIRFHWIHKTGMVQIMVNLPPMPAFVMGLTPEQFFAACDGIAQIAAPFIEELKNKLEAHSTENLSATLNSEELDKLMELKKKMEGDDA